MINKNLNKKKINFKFIFKFFILFIIILFLAIYGYKSYESNIIKKTYIHLIDKISLKYGYTLEEVIINDLSNIKKSDIEDEFNQYYGKSIFNLPLKSISKNIANNHWVDFISIKNNYKNKVFINIIESVPIGINYNQKNIFLFDKNGKILDKISSNSQYYKNLIKFKGNKSINEANDLIELLPSKIKNDIEEAIFINNRRWDLKLENGIKIKLPENNIFESFDNYIKLINNIAKYDLKKIESIDLRLTNKAIIKFKSSKND